jgi:hypothetical protein
MPIESRFNYCNLPDPRFRKARRQEQGGKQEFRELVSDRMRSSQRSMASIEKRK